jgi:hypothetical protein
MSTLKSGVELAVFPNALAVPSEVLEIVQVRHVGSVAIELTDGRMYATLNGAGLNNSGCVTVVTDAHRAALMAKGR